MRKLNIAVTVFAFQSQGSGDPNQCKVSSQLLPIMTNYGLQPKSFQ